jgi:DNA-binding response OmpR family regulator
MGDRARLILVEEDTRVARGIARSLAAHGYSIRIASSGEEAQAACGEQPFDCGVFDVADGAMDGIAIAKALVRAGAVRSAVLFSRNQGAQRAPASCPTPDNERVRYLRVMIVLACRR